VLNSSSVFVGPFKLSGVQVSPRDFLHKHVYKVGHRN
jgi:hypothetical protein